MNLAALDTIYRAPGPDRVQQLNAGINATVFAALAATINVSAATLAVSLGLSPRTLRNRTRRLTADETERSFRVYRVLRRATDVLGDAASAKAWMNTPQRALGEKTPLSLLVRDVGTEDVLNVLGAIEDGGYL
jgi:putative toxin-antitoxin system antitoxin component (TIGR02293 family)